jgi:hypothetical protein
LDRLRRVEIDSVRAIDALLGSEPAVASSRWRPIANLRCNRPDIPVGVRATSERRPT